jgi:predicted ATPase/class 3 adenylate cyclase
MKPVRRDLPSGTITFLFTDVEGSTRLLHGLGEESYAEALAEHRRILREAFVAHGGVEVDTQGDAFFVAFPTAPGALQAAAEATEALAPGPIRIRMGIHTGTPYVGEEGYVGVDVHRAARIAACGHGGQVLVSASTALLVGVDDLRDLGEHRLKDLSAPERLYQLGDAEFPPLTSLYRTNLPIPATPFLGREAELAEVASLLAREDVRLLTLTGPGGTGKTRLALQAAARSADAYPHGVYWVPLAPLRDPALVLEEAAQVLGVKDGLAGHIADKELLLLFDNFEQVVEAAPGLSELLASCPKLDLLVTSREVLQLPAEQAYSVPPLDEQDGAALFLARARAADHGFEPTDRIGELCGRLDNLPLAIELAASRVRLLSPEQLLERLSGRLDLLKAGRAVDARQQTLRATIEWSYDLLTEGEQQLFARLAVFRGGCTVEAAEIVCDADLDTLQSLVDKSLVRARDDDRFWMLETIREYAAERLEESGEGEALRREHAEHFLALAEVADPHARAYSRKWLDRLGQEHDNLRAAIDWFTATGETESCQRLVGALGNFWGIRGHMAEGSRRTQSALAADVRPTAARGRALVEAAGFALGRGDDAEVRMYAEQASELYQRLGDDWGAAASLFLLGHAAADEGKFEDAAKLAEQSEKRFRDADDDHEALSAAWLLGWALRALGATERARSLDERTLAEARVRGAKDIQAHLVESLALRMVEDGCPGDALPLFREAYEINLELDDRWRMALVACRLATALIALGEPERATQVLASGEGQLEDMGADPAWRRDSRVRDVGMLRDKLGEVSFAEAWEEGRKLAADEAVALALDGLGFRSALRQSGDTPTRQVAFQGDS